MHKTTYSQSVGSRFDPEAGHQFSGMKKSRFQKTRLFFFRFDLAFDLVCSNAVQTISIYGPGENFWMRRFLVSAT